MELAAFALVAEETKRAPTRAAREGGRKPSEQDSLPSPKLNSELRVARNAGAVEPESKPEVPLESARRITAWAEQGSSAALRGAVEQRPVGPGELPVSAWTEEPWRRGEERPAR